MARETLIPLVVDLNPNPKVNRERVKGAGYEAQLNDLESRLESGVFMRHGEIVPLNSNQIRRRKAQARVLERLLISSRDKIFDSYISNSSGDHREGKVSVETMQKEEASVLDGLEGVYVGFSPTDASDVVLGEIELTITKKTVKYRMATGLEIEEDEAQIAHLVITEMSKEEIRGLYENPPDELRARAFKVGDEPWLIISEDQEPGAAVRLFAGEMPEMLGPTILFTPNQIEKGLLEEAIIAIEKEHGKSGVIPRLNNNGEAPRSSSTYRGEQPSIKQDRPDLEEVAGKYFAANRRVLLKYNGEDAKKLREEAANFYSEAVDLTARILLESTGEDGEIFLRNTAAGMFTRGELERTQGADFFLAVGIKIAEIANTPQETTSS